ncbi:cell division protein ZapA [Sphingomonas sp. S2-65]|uniref:cell division protein ZapA n=1 Tax=Sphingomonas sp. S2-65 TaxID=2903960 RepID=UPI001F2BA27C|nr:cell division protein ZapA [Sphingomonas sp. S2-65]UYY58871.1 cell division protein ZapA [Sphingomonas sp. S2-65]
MADVTLTIAGRGYVVAARDGDEAHLRRLEKMLQKHSPAAQRASGGMSAERTLVYLSLILADLLDEAQENPPPAAAAPTGLLDEIANRLEAVAAALEQDATP